MKVGEDGDGWDGENRLGNWRDFRLGIDAPRSLESAGGGLGVDDIML